MFYDIQKYSISWRKKIDFIDKMFFSDISTIKYALCALSQYHTVTASIVYRHSDIPPRNHKWNSWTSILAQHPTL